MLLSFENTHRRQQVCVVHKLHKNAAVSVGRMLQLAVCMEEPRRRHAVSQTLRRVQSVEIFQQFNLVLVTSEPQVAFCNVVTMYCSLVTV